MYMCMRMTCACVYVCVMCMSIYSLYTELTLSFREIRVSYLCLTLLLVGQKKKKRITLNLVSHTQHTQ